MADKDKAKAAPKADDHGKRLDRLERDLDAFRELARVNGWSLPE